MKEQQYIKQLEDKLFELFNLVTDHSLYSFLSDMERKKVGEILTQTTEARKQYNT
jgi:hypothetical protein